MLPFSVDRSRFHVQANVSEPYYRRNDETENADSSEKGTPMHYGDTNGNELVKSPLFQNGVLRTNCIDCLDRTNVAQYSYGLSALGHQLHALGLIDVAKLDLSSPVADDLMRLHKEMGDVIAIQYGGSPAQNKVFSRMLGLSHDFALKYSNFLSFSVN